MNGDGIRAPIPSSYAPADLLLRRPAAGHQPGPPFGLVMGDVFAVLPFVNDAAIVTVTGDQVWAIAEHGLGALPAAKGAFPQIAGLKATFDSTAPAGSCVLPIVLEGETPITKSDTAYSHATSDFLYFGGDVYTMLVGTEGHVTDRLTDVVADYIKSLGTISLEVKPIGRNSNASRKSGRTSTTSVASAIAHRGRNQQPSMGRRGSQDTPMRRRACPQRRTRCPSKRGRHVRGLGHRRQLRLARTCLPPFTAL